MRGGGLRKISKKALRIFCRNIQQYAFSKRKRIRNSFEHKLAVENLYDAVSITMHKVQQIRI